MGNFTHHFSERIARKQEQEPLGAYGFVWAKAKRMSYHNTKPFRTIVPLERTHIDKGGPITPPTFGNKAHYEIYVDEASRYKWLFLLTLKSETLSNFDKFRVQAERQCGRQIKVIMTDNVLGYRSKALRDYCSRLGYNNCSQIRTRLKRTVSPKNPTML